MKVSVIGSKGGVGTTTVAAGLADLIRDHGHHVLFVSEQEGDVDALVGEGMLYDRLPRLAELEANWDEYESRWDVTVVDEGTGPVELPQVVVLVVGNDYRSLRAAVALGILPDYLVVVEEPARALGFEDARNVLGMEVDAIVPCTNAIARQIDAGMFTHRGTGMRPFYKSLGLLAQQITARVAAR